MGMAYFPATIGSDPDVVSVGVPYFPLFHRFHPATQAELGLIIGRCPVPSMNGRPAIRPIHKLGHYS
jgi:hypothetical protein